MLRAFLDRLARPSPVTPEAARTRVARGAAFLDAAEPGWPDRLDPDRLELADGSHCVLGQLHGAFRLGLLRTRLWDASSAGGMGLLSRTSPVALGFFARTDVEDILADLDYSYLNAAWRDAIAARRTRPEPVRRAPRRHYAAG